MWVSSGSVARTNLSLPDDAHSDRARRFRRCESDVPFQDWGTCSVTPTTITCDFQPFFSDGLGREVTIRARATGTGAISHHATVSQRHARSRIPTTMRSNPELNRAVALKTFTLTPATLAGGQTSVAEVTLTDRPPAGDALVKLTSSRPDTAPVPAVFDVPGFAVTGRRQFPIVPAVVSAPTTVQITATYGLVTVTKTLTVVPPTLKQLYLTPTTVIGGCGQSQGRVVLNGAAPAGGAVVPLTNSNSKATVPKNVTVPAGSNTVSFTVTTIPVTIARLRRGDDKLRRCLAIAEPDGTAHPRPDTDAIQHPRAWRNDSQRHGNARVSGRAGCSRGQLHHVQRERRGGDSAEHHDSNRRDRRIVQRADQCRDERDSCHHLRLRFWREKAGDADRDAVGARYLEQ